MAKNRFSNQSKQQTPAVSPSYAFPVDAAVNTMDDDDDICPVCDGECTCDHRPRQPSTSGKFHSSPSRVVSSSMNPSSPPIVPRMQSLKIKLTIPPSMLGKRRAVSSSKKPPLSVVRMTSAYEDEDEETVFTVPLAGTSTQSQHASTSTSLAHNSAAPKRRGRPPKAVVAAREAAKTAAANDELMSADSMVSGPSQSHNPSQPQPRSYKRKIPLSNQKSGRKLPEASRPPPKLKTKAQNTKRAPVFTKKRRVLMSEESESDNDLDHDGFTDDEDEDAQSTNFPTFLPASALSSGSSSDTDSSSLSGFDSDSSIEAEEENFILTEEQRAHDKARVRRELMGDEGPQKRKDPQNDWVIRPRKRSVGLEDADMDVDSEDATEDEDEDEEEGDADDDEEADSKDSEVVYAGVATGWSEDDESSFDADLFFANLSGTSTDSDSDSEMDDDEHDADASEADATSLSELRMLAREEGKLEITEGWDGQMVFTNGVREGRGILDLDFEANAAQMIGETSSTTSQDSDVEMQTSDSCADGEFEDDDLDQEASDGETTEEELVGANGLPTERAMALFRFPNSVSAIDPMSTLSPSVSPSPINRRRKVSGSRGPPESPRPADILAGKIFWEEEDHDCDHPESPQGSPFTTRSQRGGPPSMGCFATDKGTPQRRVILDGSVKDIPSPFPRARRRRVSSRASNDFGSFGSLSAMNLRGRAASRQSSLSRRSQSSFRITSPEAHLSPTSPEFNLAEPIELDDVLEASFLESDTRGVNSHSSGGESAHQTSLNRWDMISVGAFRQTRETSVLRSDWTPETPRVASSDGIQYEHMMKNSPFSTMLWPNKDTHQPKRARGNSRASLQVNISPVILPVGDGDRTPTIPSSHELHRPIPDPDSNSNRGPNKTRKQLRREKKLQRKNSGPVMIHNQYPHHQHYYQHQHHPNMKSRSSSAMQRTNFFSITSSVPPLNL